MHTHKHTTPLDLALGYLLGLGPFGWSCTTTTEGGQSKNASNADAGALGPGEA